MKDVDVLDVIVIGGGQAGLASGYHLQKKGLRYLILEANDRTIGSWGHYYDSLKLFSPARFSSLPGMKIPADPDKYPIRDEVIRYLEDYAKHFQLSVLTNQRVESVKKEGKVFAVHTKSGDCYQTKTIINATGSFHSPFKPVIQNEEVFKGRIIHSAEYQNPEPFSNQRVVVVGRRNSAVQIAVELSEVSEVTLAVRQPVQLINQRVLGKDLHFWVKVTGLDGFPFWRLGKTAPSPSGVNNPGHYREMLTAGKPNQQPMFTSFCSAGVIWEDGSKELVDTVIFATGYQPNLDYLKSSGALDSEGLPLHSAGISTSVPGIYYVGLEGQRSFRSATLRGVGPDAKFVIRKLIRYLKS
ncbi:flavin-containing monooxygenase [Pseudalkalibacillus decolorationis]|uniref:flavin-containing monooxygenase n=1 Tax=Pseudalkalibacillus decolorationis TaxID=163879 RepID=UPI002147233E|nr:NAD(P)/FAD-dependent oxidoreductase [Pseudalkalibacillus decolorationis]